MHREHTRMRQRESNRTTENAPMKNKCIWKWKYFINSTDCFSLSSFCSCWLVEHPLWCTSSRAMDLSFAHSHHVSWIYLSISLHVHAIFFAFVSLTEFIHRCEWSIFNYSSGSVSTVYSTTIATIDDIDNYSHCFSFSFHLEPRHGTMFSLFLQLYVFPVIRVYCNCPPVSCVICGKILMQIEI